MSQYHYLFKLIIVGDQEVGKSCILLQLTDKKFNDEYDPTIGVEFGTYLIQSKDKTLKLQIWDTSGQESFRSITKSYYKSSIGGLVVFDITNRQSFKNVQQWYNEVKGRVTEDCQFVLVGNKTDLEAERKTSTLEAQEFAEKYNMQYVEVSAKTGQNLHEVFATTALKILQVIENIPEDEDQQIMLEMNGIKKGDYWKQKQN